MGATAELNKLSLADMQAIAGRITAESLSAMSRDDLKDFYEIVKELDLREQTNKIEEYQPYPFQRRFHKDGAMCNQRLLMAANQVGKSRGAACETTYHLTGQYPDWWEGQRFTRPVMAWCCGATNEKTRDTVQKLLFGDPIDDEKFGMGFVPRKNLDINRTVRKPGVPNAWQAVQVAHHTNGVFDGWSTCVLKAYEMGYKVFTSEQVDIVWLDEEPPEAIMSQCLIRMATTRGNMYMTFTPEEGMTAIVAQFMTNLKTGQSLTIATWDDAPHMTPELQKLILDKLPPHERDMRSKGVPMVGQGLVFPIREELIKVEPFKIPDYWAHICGLDIGAWNHYTAASWIAHDRDSDTVYVYDCYKAQGQTPPIHAAALKARGDDITIIYPHDAEKGDRQTGKAVAQQYRELGCNMHYTHFTNPPAEGEKEGEGGNSVEAGLIDMHTRMETGRFKVFSHLAMWFEEFRFYHRKDGKVVRNNEDLMSATRYAARSLRFAEPRGRGRMTQAIDYDCKFNPLEYRLSG